MEWIKKAESEKSLHPKNNGYKEIWWNNKRKLLFYSINYKSSKKENHNNNSIIIVLIIIVIIIIFDPNLNLLRHLRRNTFKFDKMKRNKK